MYLTIDLASPVKGEYLLNSRAKRRILNHWTRTTFDGVEVFDRLYLYNNGAVQETEDHLKLYQLLGVDIDAMKAESYDGVDEVWLKFSYTPLTDPLSITHQQLYDYVQDSCSADVTYEITLNYIQTSPMQNYGGIKTGVELTTYLNGLFASPYSGKLTVTERGNNPAYFIALQDVENTLFTTSVTIGATDIKEFVSSTSVSANSITHTTSVRFQFTLKPTAIGACATLFDRLRHSDHMTTEFHIAVNGIEDNGLFIQKDSFYNTLVAFNGDTDTYEEEVTGTKADTYLTVSGFEALKVREAGKLLQDSIESGYKEEDAEWWEVFLNAIIIIIAVVVTIISGGSAASAAVGLVAKVGAFATVAATVLTVVVLAQFALSYVLKEAGHYGGAILFGKSMVVMSKFLKVAGILSLFGSIMTVLQKGFTKTVINAAGKKISGVAMTFGDISLQVMSWLNKGYGVYTEYNGDEQQEELDAAEKRAEDQEEELESRTPQAMSLMQANFESYYFLDANEQIDDSYYALTQGKIDGSTTKYYS